MRVLLLGSGGREHALAWKLAQSPKLTALFCAPGNPGMAEVAQACLSLDISDHAAVLSACQEHAIELVVVGPEAPLVAGLADTLRDAGIKVIGPAKAAAQLEGSKQFAKDFMQRHGIPTARYGSFTSQQLNEALAFLGSMAPPYVIKASGLAAGKGVIITSDKKEAETTLRGMLTGGMFGEAGNQVVIEQFLEGVEVSVFILTDGSDYILLPTAKDYKRIGEGDTGPNTGGMGAISPAPFVDAALQARIKEQVIAPTLKGLKEDGLPYQGFIFFGLMVAQGTPYLLEYNVRMGDPETQGVMPLIESDLLEWFEVCTSGSLSSVEPRISSAYSATTVLVSQGYPGTYQKGKPITGLDRTRGVTVFHAGTKEAGGELVTSGGRVLALNAVHSDLGQAIIASQMAAFKVRFEGATYRSDIGKDMLQLLK